MAHTRQHILEGIQNAEGIAYYGELLLASKNMGESNISSLRTDAFQEPKSWEPASDVLNVMRSIKTLQEHFGTGSREISQVFTGPISSIDPLGNVLAQKFSFPILQDFHIPIGEVGLSRIGKTESGTMQILLDSKRAAIRDAIHDTFYRDAVICEAKRCGVFYTSLIGLGMSRLNSDMKIMLQAIHEEGVVTVFDTNYRSYVMQHCYLENNSQSPGDMIRELIPAIDLLLAGTDDIYSLHPNMNRQIKHVQREFFKQTSSSAISVLKAGNSGAYWKNDNAEWVHLPAKKVAVHNTTGAGDTFNAGLLFALHAGKNVEDSIGFGHAAASEVVKREESFLHKDSISSLPWI